MQRHNAPAAPSAPQGEPRAFRGVADRRVCSSLLLQQVLFYQPWFSIGWIIFWVVWLFSTYFKALTYRDEDVVRTVLMVLWVVAEPFRILAGYFGNLQEHMPWLILYIILTMVPHHVTTYYMLVTKKGTAPVTQAVQVCQAVLLEVALLAGLHAVWKLFRQQRKQYYLFEFAMSQRAKAEQEQQ